MNSRGQSLVELEQRALSAKLSDRPDEAARLYEQLLQEQPDWEHGTAAYDLAQCYEDLGRLEDARRTYLRALQHDPANTIFLGGYASFLYLHGDPMEAFNEHLKLRKLRLEMGNVEGARQTMLALRALGENMGWTEAELEKRISVF